MDVSKNSIFKILIIVSLIGVAICQVQEQGQNNNCKLNGEYCQNHWECCSNSCLSYLYRCTKNHQNKSSENNIIQNSPQNQIIDQSEGTISYKPITYEEFIFGLWNPVPESTSNTLQIGERIDLTDENSTILSNNTIDTTAATITTEKLCLQIGEKCYKNNECCTQRCHGFLHQCVT